MKEVLIMTYELMTMLVPVFLAEICIRRNWESFWKRRRKRLVMLLIFVLYLAGVFHVTGAGTLYSALQFRQRPDQRVLQLIPFSDPDFSPAGYFLNLVLFMPLGFLLLWIWPDRRKRGPVPAAGFCLSLLVETSQLLNYRVTDVDDLILNTAGTLLGAALYMLIFGGGMKKKAGARKKRVPDGTWPRPPVRWEPWLIMGVMFLGRFFFFNEFGAARMIYGF